uniref:Heat shock 70 kDa protein 14 n=1 Tax=Strigamia maritima TaxID=126957 RepID=T1JFC1_STRMM
MTYFGIHVGSSTCSLAISQSGITEIVTNDAGERVTPVVVAFNDKETVVGLSARQGLIRNGENTITHVKKLLACKIDDKVVEKYNSTHTCKLVATNNGKLCFNGDSSSNQTPQTVLSAIISNLLETARSRCGKLPSYNSVVAVPYHFTDAQRELIKETATKCGFTITQIISEPAACLLAYYVGQLSPKEDGFCLVYRVGGQSLDVTIVYVSAGIYSIVSSVCKDDIGGDNITQLLVKHFAEEFRRKIHSDVYESRRSVAKLASVAENCKHILSSVSTAQCFVESLHEGADFNCNMTRARFESLLKPVIAELIEPIDEALEKAELKRDDIKRVILAGGAMKTPKLQDSLNEIFKDAEISSSIPTDEVIAMGSAYQAAMDEVTVDADTPIKCIPRGIYISVIENGCQKLFCVFPRRTIIPAHAQKCFTVPAEQNSLCIEILEKNETMADDSSMKLGKIVLKELPSDPEVVATFHLRRDGSLHVTCSDKRSACHSGITIESSVS